MSHIQAQKFNPQPRCEPALYHCWQARKIDVLTVTPHIAPIFALCCVDLWCWCGVWGGLVRYCIVLHCIIDSTVYTVTDLIGRPIIGTDSVREILFLYCVVLWCWCGVVCGVVGEVLYCTDTIHSTVYNYNQTCLPQNTSLSVLQTAYVRIFRFLTRFFADVPPISQNKTVPNVNFSIIHLAKTVCELTFSIIQSHCTRTTLFCLQLQKSFLIEDRRTLSPKTMHRMCCFR